MRSRRVIAVACSAFMAVAALGMLEAGTARAAPGSDATIEATAFDVALGAAGSATAVRPDGKRALGGFVWPHAATPTNNVASWSS